MSRVTPFLWFNDQAEQAAEFYVSVIPNSRMLEVSRFAPDAPGQAAGVSRVRFLLDGVEVMALNGGPMFPFTEAFSFSVSVDDQAEVDRLWDALTGDGGEPGQCGWLKDRWGLSWQIVPSALDALIGDPDPERANRAIQAMLSMGKLDIAALRAAADG
ncbi:3-demethylubiquinone-9 3-methyltransferase [Leifsonia sp. Root227]|uniref:VOC family protein n=1 Tax=Leifsonia sp. Root227 TaxID=1736496 RepID=UPI0006FC023A|nr:VOC family protein [Leifsonia sp. Root227]KRC51165.1 3-demethylubiquinone-9 3-methyltransferase [Leifsonia sp. Root227]